MTECKEETAHIMPQTLGVSTRYQEKRYRLTKAGRAFRSNHEDDDFGQFLFAAGCCAGDPEGCTAECTGISIGEMKNALHSTEHDFRESLKNGIDVDQALFMQTIKMHRRICTRIDEFIRIGLSGENNRGRPTLSSVS